MSYKENHRMENKTLPVALLVTGIVCIMPGRFYCLLFFQIFSCCFVWLVVRCERWRRRRKYRPKGGNRYSINASHMANGQELKDLAPRNLKPSVNLIHYSSKNSVTSQSIPSLLSADSMDDSIASEPLYTGRRFGEDEPDTAGYHVVHDLSIARILGSFPELPYYQSASAASSAENVRDTSKGNIGETSTTSSIPIPRPRSTVTAKLRSKDFSLNNSLHTDYYPRKPSVESVNKSQSSAESLKLEIPGGAIRIRDMSDVFPFTKLRAKKGQAVSTPNVSEVITDHPKISAPTFETEV